MAPPAGGGQQDNSTGILWTIAAIFAAIGIIWYAFSVYIIIFYLTIKSYEVDFLNVILGDRYQDLHSALLYALSHPRLLSFADVVSLGQSASAFLKYPFAILLGILAIVTYFSNSARFYQRTYNMKDLVRFEKENWPQIMPVATLDLLSIDLDQGSWAMAMQPLFFCKKNNLLEEVRVERRLDMTHKDRNKIEAVLRRGEANKLFILQLGPLWQGTRYLQPYTKGLFAAFAARINADSASASLLLKQFNLSCQAKNIDMRHVDDILKKYENTKLVQAVLKKHAYVYTVMASMLETAREDGVQASADFLWLKPLDRRLWYILNCVGRQTAFIEIAGAFAHWKAEKEAGIKLLTPVIEEATKALEVTLKEIVYKPDEIKS